jgi:serine/threonine protein kinase
MLDDENNVLLNLVTVNLNHFRLLRVVGKGAFGKVRIVERKDTGCTFALKYIRKDEGTCHAVLSYWHSGAGCRQAAHISLHWPLTGVELIENSCTVRKR